MTTTTFTAFFPFCGLGAGARGFLDAQVQLLGREARFEALGGIDNDPLACEDFEYLVGAPALCADIATLTPAELIEFAGPTAPDVVFSSPPCKGFSGLLGKKASKAEKYEKLNRLVIQWVELMLRTWGDDPPSLFLLENVPRIASRGKELLARVKTLLAQAGYVFHEQSHDCGELGGLAQHRRRFLLVARHPKKCPPPLYQPPKKRVRACGEVLGELPMPEDPIAGPLHKMPRISWLNWVRLALIPAGGDWRDLNGVLAEGQKRREVHKRHAVEGWEDPTGAVTGPGSSGVANVADPRALEQLGFSPYGVKGWDEPSDTVTGRTTPSNGRFSVADPRVKGWGGGPHGVKGWDEAAGAVTGESRPSNGPFAVADPRILGLSDNPTRHRNKYSVKGWDEASNAVIGATRPGSGAPSVADPRIGELLRDGTAWHHGAMGVQSMDEPAATVTGGAKTTSGRFSVADPRAAKWFGNVYRVVPWIDPAGTVTGGGHPSNGGGAVADARIKRAYDHGYRVLPWADPSFTIHGQALPGTGAYSVADPRVKGTPRAGSYGVIPWYEAAKTVTGHANIDNGAWAVADPRFPEAEPIMVIKNIRRAPPSIPVIIAEDGTWHRPMTTLELAVLQGLPTVVNGKPLCLAGNRVDGWRERIGNAVPVGAARAIAEQMLVALTEAAAGAFQLHSGSVWVEPEQRYAL